MNKSTRTISPITYTKPFFLILFVILLCLSGCAKPDHIDQRIYDGHSSVSSLSDNTDFSTTTAFTDPDPTSPEKIPGSAPADSPTKAPTAVPSSTPVPTPAATQITLLAVGDNLIHTQVIKSGKQTDGSYQFDHLYSNLKETISAADIAVINQETVFAGKSYGYSGYPNFNSPTEVGDAVINAGFDVVLHATNHAMDMGVKGITNTLAYWKQHPQITVVGMNESQKARDIIPVIEKNGIKLALLNYTYGLNGYVLPKSKPYLVNLLYKNAMKEDIQKARELADFIIVFPHWGNEYQYKPSKAQEDLTTFFYEEGVDLVIGSHPHVLEPVEWIETVAGHRMLVYYSLGNFISYQREAPRMLGGMAQVTITKDASGTYISDSSITPIVTHFENGFADYHYAIYPLADYTPALAGLHSVTKIASQGPFTYQGTYELANDILGSWFP